MKKIMISLFIGCIALFASSCSCGNSENPPQEKDVIPVTLEDLYSIPIVSGDEGEKIEYANTGFILENMDFSEIENPEKRAYSIASILDSIGIGELSELTVEERTIENGYVVQIVDKENNVYYMILDKNGYVIRIDKDRLGGEVLWVTLA